MILYIVLLLDSIVLQPFRVVVGFLLRFCWHPPEVERSLSPYSLDDLLMLARDRLRTLDRSKYGQGGDSAKFLGMLYYATGDDAEWQNVMRLIRPDGTIRRSHAEPSPEGEEVPFSADMLAGLLLAVLRRFPALSGEELARLKKLWERTTWQGFPLLFANAGNGKKELFGRGHVWRPWWIFGSEDILTALVWLYMGWKITGETRYRVAYYAFLLLQFPSLLFGCPDAQIWIGRVYGIATYNTHSRALGFFAGWKLTGNVFFRLALAQSYARHGAYNADICILAGSVAGKAGWRETALELAGNAVDKGYFACPQDRRYLSLFWPPERVMRSASIVSPIYRGGDYIWERNPVKGDCLDDIYRAQKGLDLIFPAFLLRLCAEEDEKARPAE